MNARREIVAHTSLRGIASLLVVLFHFRSFLHPAVHVDEWTRFFANGYLWVDFFFMLSGFILSYVYLGRLGASADPGVARRYAIARIARIYPLHLASLLVVVVFFASLGTLSLLSSGEFCCLFESPFRSVESLLANLFLVHAWGWLDNLSWNIPSWSISAEFACYLAFGLLMLAHEKVRKYATVLMPLLAMIYYAYFLVSQQGIDQDYRLSVPRALASFWIGVAVYHRRGLSTRIGELPLGTLQIGLLLLLGLFLHIDVGDVYVVLLMPGLILLTADDRGPVCRLLSARPFYLLGLYSYSIYLWHYPLKFVALKDWASFTGLDWFGGVSGSVVFLLMLIALVLVVSGLSYRYLERPARRWMVNRFSGRSP